VPKEARLPVRVPALCTRILVWAFHSLDFSFFFFAGVQNQGGGCEGCDSPKLSRNVQLFSTRRNLKLGGPREIRRSDFERFGQDRLARDSNPALANTSPVFPTTKSRGEESKGHTIPPRSYNEQNITPILSYETPLNRPDSQYTFWIPRRHAQPRPTCQPSMSQHTLLYVCRSLARPINELPVP